MPTFIACSKARVFPALLASTLILLLFGPYGAVALQAQNPFPHIQFEHFTQADGLPTDGPYRSMVQDRQGFLWLGSELGLTRYDGYQFETYRHDPLDTTSVLMGSIWALYEDADGILWVGSNGLSRFEATTETFTQYRHDPDDPASLTEGLVWAILQTRDGSLWVGTSHGLSRMDRQTGTFIQYRHNPDDERSLSHDRVLALHEDQEGTLWVGTGDPNDLPSGGLDRYDPATDSFTRLGFGSGQSSLNNPVLTIAEDGNGTLYIGTCPARLYQVIPSTGEGPDRIGERLEPLLPNTSDPNQLHAPPGGPRPWCTGVQVIHEDRDGMLWVGTNGGGLNYYDPAAHTLTRFRYDPKDPRNLSSDNVTFFYEDRQGGRWIGTHDKGINKTVVSAHRFRNYGADEISANQGVSALYEDDDGLLWMGTDSGQLFRFDPATGAIQRFSRPQPTPDVLWGAPIRDMVMDQDGILWVFGGAGVFQFDPLRRTYTQFHPDPDDPDFNSPVRLGEVDERGNVWIGTLWRGLYRYDRHTGLTTRFSFDPTDEHSLRSNGIVTLYQDQQGVRWFGTQRGVNRFDEKTETFTSYLDEVTVLQLHEDRGGRFWVGTETDGLFLLDRTTGQAIRHYTMQDGLPHNEVNGIVEDDLGLLWLTTPGGLARFNPETEIPGSSLGQAFTTYNEDDGLDTYTSRNNLALLSRRGLLFIGGTKGLTRIDPAAFTPNPFPPTSVIRGLRIFETDHALPDSREAPIRLAHDENELTFSYVGLHFTKPSRNRYRYRLEGYDTDWREAGTVRTATYTNLSPGTYTFHVKAANSDGVWDEAGTSLRVTIRPPWWRTWWANLLYGLLFLAGVYVADRFQRRRLIRKERERVRERELEQAREIEKAHIELQQSHEHLKATQAQLIQSEKMASLGQLTAGIAHEIKNPLNFINNFAEVNEELAQELREALANGEDVQDLLADLEQNAAVIAQHGKRADGIVHAMMQHASGGTGQREPTDINQLVSEHIDLAYHGKRAQMPELQVKIERSFAEGVHPLEIVPQEIGRVLLNLLGNAFDAVHAHVLSVNGQYEPTVTVSTQRVGDAVEIRVADNGPGIPAEMREKIFEPFFTTKPTGSGTGLGLSMSYDIITQGHGGTLTVESEEGQGATFIVTLPTNQTEPDY